MSGLLRRNYTFRQSARLTRLRVWICRGLYKSSLHDIDADWLSLGLLKMEHKRGLDDGTQTIVSKPLVRRNGRDKGHVGDLSNTEWFPLTGIA